MSGPAPCSMSRRKAGYVPRRVDPEPDQDDMETPELVIDVKPERDVGALGPLAPKDVSMPGPLGTERRFGTAPLPLGARSPWAPWIPLSLEPSGESAVLSVRIGTLRWVSLCPGTRLASLALAPAGIETLRWVPLCPGTRLTSPAFAPACTGTLRWVPLSWGWPRTAWPPQPSLLTSGFPLSTLVSSPLAGPHPTAHHPLPPCRPPALDQQAPRSVDLRPLPADLPIGGHHSFHGPQKTGLSDPPGRRPHFR